MEMMNNIYEDSLKVLLLLVNNRGMEYRLREGQCQSTVSTEYRDYLLQSKSYIASNKVHIMQC